MTQALAGGHIVHVVDGDSRARHNLRRLLQDIGLPVEDHASADQFIEQYEPDEAECALVAMRMPHMSGLDLLRWLRRRGDRLPVIMVSAHGDVPSAMQALRLGAADFITKPISEQLLIDRITEIRRQQRLRRQVETDRDVQRIRLTRLTGRERQIVLLIVAGYATKQIARRLGISHKTVENRRRGIYDKLNVETVAELVALVVPMLGGCRGEGTGPVRACGLMASDPLPCRLNPPSDPSRACPLVSPGLHRLDLTPAVRMTA